MIADPNVDPSQLQTDPYWSQFQPHDQTSVSLQNPAPTSPMLPQNGTNIGGLGTPPIPPAATGYTPPTSGQSWDQNYFSTNFGTPRTPQELVALEAKITAAGGKVLRNAAGVAGKIQTPDGRIIDVINSAGAGGNGFQWLDGGGGSGGGSSLGSLGYQFGDAMKPFTPPTAEDALNSPGLKFAMGEANRMRENGYAARGTILNGRVIQGLDAANIGAGLQGYGDVWNRAYQTHVRNEDAPFDKNLSLAKLGQPG